MKSTLYVTGAVLLSLFSAVAPPRSTWLRRLLRWSNASPRRKQEYRAGHEARVQATQIEAVDRDLSRTKERLTDTDAKAVAAGNAARQANDAAMQANTKAQGAQSSADTANTTAKAACKVLLC